MNKKKHEILLLVILLTSFSTFAATQYWNPSSTPAAAGNSTWSTAANAWSDTNAGTDAPGPWIDGNDANFTLNAGENIVAVEDTLQAGTLTFGGNGAYTFNYDAASLITKTLKFSSDRIQLTLQGNGYIQASLPSTPKPTAISTAGYDEINITINGSGVEGEQMVFNYGYAGLTIGSVGWGNTLTLDGRGITDGVLVTNISNDVSGLVVGASTDSSNNVVRVIGGATLHDRVPDSNRNNALGLGVNANNNRIEIIGGEGYVSTILKEYGDTIGENGATGNTILVDGQGYAKSALADYNRNTSLIGNTNSIRIINGGVAQISTIGIAGFANRIEIIGADSQMIGAAGSGGFAIKGTSNSVYVADGGKVTSYAFWTPTIGGEIRDITSKGQYIGNTLLIGPNGYVNFNKTITIGMAYEAEGLALGNRVIISGENAQMVNSDSAFNIGYASKPGSRAESNEMRIENQGKFSFGGNSAVRCAKLGTTANGDTTTIASNNRLIITSGGIFEGHGVIVGSDEASVQSAANQVLIFQGGILSVKELNIRKGDANNTIKAFDGGVLQFTTTQPTITSQNSGDISVENAVLSFYDEAKPYTDVHLNESFESVVFSGHNALRLAGSTMNIYIDNSYLFELSDDPTHFYRLEMVDGETTYQGKNGSVLTIGSAGGEMLCSNTTAVVAMPFIMNGSLEIATSTLTLEKSAELNGDISINLNSMPESGALFAEDTLTIGDTATLKLSGKPTEGQIIMTASSDIAGDFTVEGLPSNYTTSFKDGILKLMHTTTILSIR